VPYDKIMRWEKSMDNLEASSLVRKFGSKAAAATFGKPILDVACGAGRNALFLSDLGCTVLCMDRDLSSLRELVSQDAEGYSSGASGRLILQQIDLVNDPWPFASASVGGIVNVHFTLPALFPFFGGSLIPNGYLLLETVPGCGGNYMELPKKGELKAALEASFFFEMYKEHPVGPPDRNAVTVKLAARRRV
jgi:SAM-dependent methyltransferase